MIRMKAFDECQSVKSSKKSKTFGLYLSVELNYLDL